MSKAIFSDFLEELDKETKEKFVNALGEHELFDFCSSQEEFCVVTGRDPKREFRKQPELADDVKYTEEGLREKIEQRFEKFQAAFPQTQSLDALKEHVKERTQPQMSVSITLNMMREKSGTNSPRSSEEQA
jgi:hypothetical protein